MYVIIELICLIFIIFSLTYFLAYKIYFKSTIIIWQVYIRLILIFINFIILTIIFKQIKYLVFKLSKNMFIKSYYFFKFCLAIINVAYFFENFQFNTSKY